MSAPRSTYSTWLSVPRDRDLVFVSGQVAVRDDGTIPAGWEAQAETVFGHLGRVLAEAGATWPDVVKLTLFLTSMDGLATVRAVRDRHIALDHPPTSSLVQVAALVQPDLLLEVDAVAAVGRRPCRTKAAYLPQA